MNIHAPLFLLSWTTSHPNKNLHGMWFRKDLDPTYRKCLQVKSAIRRLDYGAHRSFKARPTPLLIWPHIVWHFRQHQYKDFTVRIPYVNVLQSIAELELLLWGPCCERKSSLRIAFGKNIRNSKTTQKSMS